MENIEREVVDVNTNMSIPVVGTLGAVKVSVGGVGEVGGEGGEGEEEVKRMVNLQVSDSDHQMLWMEERG